MAANPGSVRAESIHFDIAQAPSSAAGVWTGTVEIPVGAILVDVIVYGKTLWNSGTSATLDVGDAADPNGIFAAVNLKATDLLAAEGLSVANAGGKAGADIANSQFSRTMLDAATTAPYGRVMKAVLTTVGTTTTGCTTVCFVYAYPSPKAAVYAAS